MGNTNSSAEIIEGLDQKVIDRLKRYQGKKINSVGIYEKGENVFSDGEEFELCIGDVVIELYGVSVFADYRESSVTELMQEELRFDSIKYTRSYELKLHNTSTEFILQILGIFIRNADSE